MTRPRPQAPFRLSVLALASAFAVSACGGGGTKETKASRTVIQNKGSDTMVNVAQVWAEEYRQLSLIHI